MRFRAFRKSIRGPALCRTDEPTVLSDHPMKEAITSIDLFQTEKKFWLEQIRDLQDTSYQLFLAAKVGSGKETRIVIPFRPKVADKLLKMSNQDDLLLFVLFLSIAQILLHKYTSSHDVSIAGPICTGPGREHGFNDWLLFRSRIPVGGTPRDLLSANKKCVLGAFQNQHYPLETVLCSPGFEGFRGFLPQILLTLSSLHPRTTASPHRHPLQIRFEVELTGNSILLSLGFDEDIFEPDLVRNAGHHFANICGEVVAGPLRKIGDLEFLGKAERERILVTWNQTENQLSSQSTLHSIFESTAASQPMAVAASQGDLSITYLDLNAKANRLALLLRSLLQHTSPSSTPLIGVYLEPSIDLVIGTLAVLKAGAAYVPISNSLPDARIRHIIEDAGITVLLIDREIRNEIGFSGRTIRVGDFPWEYSGANEPLPVTPADGLAYVIYTSGSTGSPKGVMVRQRGVVNSTLWRNRACGLGPDDRILNLSAYGFDGFNSFLFSSLLSGGQIVLPEATQSSDLIGIARLIEQFSITTIALIPSLYQAILEFAPRDCLSSLRLVLLAAESSSASLISTSHAIVPQAVLLNEYGPTENSVVSLAHFGMSPDNPSIVGRPISNVQAYILGEGLAPLPVGVVGEICVSGVGLAKGYLNLPTETADRFVSHPFLPNERLYRTGDMGRFRSDGSIEFRGRADHQVKIRGHRVELGEIERCMEEIPGIRKVVALMYQGNLVACFSAEKGRQEMNFDSILKQRLPTYMVPVKFIKVDDFPLTHSGKIDRKALPPLGTEKEGSSFRAPISEAERFLVKVWEGLLGNSEIGTDDNFFELGGDSIKALRMMAVLHEKDYECSVRMIFENPTISLLCCHLAKKHREIPQCLVYGSTPLTPIQMWLFEQDLAVIHHFNNSIMLFRENGFDAGILDQVFGKLVEHHDALRVIFHAGPESIQQENRGLEPSAFEISEFDATKLSASEVEPAIQEEVRRIQGSFNIASGPLMKVGVFRTSSGDHLLIVIHHLVVDVYSWQILLEDIQMAYRQAMEGLPLQLPPKTASFQLWATRLGRHARNLVGTPEEAFWNRALEAIDTKTSATTLVDPSYGTLVATRWRLDAQATKRLVRSSAEILRTSLETLLLAVFGLAWRELKGVDGVALWIEGHGREDIFEDTFVGRTVGWFTTQYPVWLPIPTDDSDLAIALVKSSLEEIPSRGLGFGALWYLVDGLCTGAVRKFCPPRILFNYLGSIDPNPTPDQLFRLSDISTGADINPEWRSPYDLSIDASISGGELALSFRYSCAILSPAEAARLGSLCMALLEEIGSAKPSPQNEIAAFPTHGESSEYYRSSRPGAPKVFFFPPKLSLGLSYYALARYLTKIEMVAFDFIERPERVEAYLDYITRIQGSGPYILGAYSSATLALEVAQALENIGATVSDIILLDAVPTVAVTDTLTSDLRAADSIEFFMKDIKHFGGEFDGKFAHNTGLKIREYSRYINTTCNHKVLDTTFHFIRSSSTDPDEPNACQAFSCRRMRLYNGFGEHSFMLNGSAARKNAVVITDIIVAAHRSKEEKS